MLSPVFLYHLNEQTVCDPKWPLAVIPVRTELAAASVGASALCAKVSAGVPHS